MSVIRIRTLSCLLSASILACLSAISAEPAEAARRRRPHPVIDRGSDVVEYMGRARIVGHLENGRPGQVVALKRRIVGVGRKIVREKEVNKDLRVVFRLKNRTRSTIFRLVFRSRKGRKRASNIHRVEVRPRLRFRVDPNDVRFRNSVELRGSLKPVAPDRPVKLKLHVAGEWRFIKTVESATAPFSRPMSPRSRAIIGCERPSPATI